MSEKFQKLIILSIGVLAMIFLISYIVLAWEEPTQAPPGANVPAPLNVSTITQTKEGRLDFTEFYDANDALRRYYVNPSGTTSAILAGNVGIGTTGPGGRLGILSGWGNWIRFDDSIVGNQYMFHNPSDGSRFEVGVYDAAAATTRWGVFTIRPSGNVGIGTTTPGEKLDVAGNINYTGQLTKLDVADNFGATVRAADFNIGHSTRRGTPGRAIVDLSSDLRFNYGNDWTTASVGSNFTVIGTLTVNNAGGNVCLSDGSNCPAIPGPGSDLTIRRLYLSNRTGGATWLALGDTYSDDWLRINPDQNFGGIALYKPVAIGTGGLAVGTWDRLPSGEGKFTYSGGYTTIKDLSGVQVYNAEGTTGEVRLGAAWGKPGVYSSGALYLFSDTTGVYIGDSNSEKMFVRADGNVGIGTTSPGQKLDVRGGVRLGENYIGNGRFESSYYGSGNRYSYIDFRGDDTYTDYGLRLLRGNGGANTWSELRHRGTGGLYIITTEAAPLIFRTSNINRMTITSDGNVNIAGNLNVGGTANIKPPYAYDIETTEWEIPESADAGTYNNDPNLSTTITVTRPSLLIIGVSGAIRYYDESVPLIQTANPHTWGYYRITVAGSTCSGSKRYHESPTGAGGGGSWGAHFDSMCVYSVAAGTYTVRLQFADDDGGGAKAAIRDRTLTVIGFNQ